MLLELHCHTAKHSSCSHLDPLDAVERARAKGLQGLVITEHHYLWTEEELRRLRADAELDEIFVLFAAQEVETDIGHVLVFGAPRTITHRTPLSELRRAWPEAALVWAHPFRGDKIPEDSALLNPLLDGVELFNSNHSPRGNYFALSAWHRLKFTAVGGSDSHGPETIGMFPTLLDHPVCTAQALAEELRHGRCRPFLKEIPRAGSNITVTDITIGIKGEDEQRQRLVIKHHRTSKKWRQQLRATSAIESLLERGVCCDTFRVPRILEVNEEERLLIEEGQRGKLLFDLLRTVSPDVADTYFELSAQWLATMHGLRLQVGDPETTVKRERRRFDSYLGAFVRSGSPHRVLAEQALREIRDREEALFAAEQGRFVLNHGDYHPKNIIIGQDRGQDISTVYVSVIDFASAMPFVPAFDVGYFRAQLRHQLRKYPEVLERQSPARFVQAYLGETAAPERFEEEVRFFEARANMSIAAFLIKVGKGESPEMAALMERTAALLHLRR
jgi:predicted metal-dependent phosphoesterase TrpH